MKFLFNKKQDMPIGKKLVENNAVQGLTVDAIKERENEFAMLNFSLDKTEMRLRTLVENIPYCIARYDTNGRFLYVNPAVTNTFGFPATHFKSKTLTELNLSLKPEEDQMLHNMVLKVVGSGKPNRTETEWLTMDGVRFYDIQHVPEKDKNGNVISVLGIIEDITERKNNEKQLKEARNRLSAVVSAMPDLVWMKSSDGKYTICNKAYEEYFGAPENEIIGKTDHDFFGDELAHRMRQEDIETMISEEIVINEESLMYTINGKKGVYETRKVPVYNADGMVSGVLGIARDISGRKQAEEKIRKLNAELSATLQAIPDLLYKVDKNGTYLNVWANNPKLLVRQKEYLLGQTVYDMLNLNAANVFMDAVREADKTGSSYGKIYQRESSEGMKWFELSVSKKVKNKGHEAHFIAISRDITDRKILEAELMSREAESRNHVQFQQLMLNGLRDTGMIILVVVNGRIIYDNDIYKGHILGYKKGELDYSTDFLSYIHPDDRAFITKNYQDRLAGKDVPNTYEAGALLKNGQRREFELFVTTIPGTSPVQILVLARDITERKMAEQQLKKKQENLEEAQHIGRIGSWEFDHVTNRLEWSKEVFRIFEIDPRNSSASYEAFLEAIHPDDREKVNHAFTESVKNKISYDLDHRLLFTGGRVKYVSEHGVTYYDKQGRPIRSIGTVRDMTQRKENEIELLKAKEKAEESNRLKSAFLSAMNHELRTPLNHIIGFSELIKSRASNAVHFAEIIRKSGQHLLELFEDIFSLAMEQEVGTRMRKQQINLGDMFSESRTVLAEILKNAGKDTNIKLFFNPENEILSSSIESDLNKISQVLGNLFKNAVKFTRQGSIEFGMYSDKKDRITFYVKDTGIGMSQKIQHVIFDPFRQGDDTLNREYEGLGVGLTISKRIAEVLRGKLHFVSTPGKGSTFYFSIPANDTREVLEETCKTNRM